MIDLSPIYRLGLDPGQGKITGNQKYYRFNCQHCMKRGEPSPDKIYRYHVCVDSTSPKFRRNHCFRCGFSVNLDSDGLDLSILRRKYAKKQEDYDSWKENPPDITLPKGFIRGLTPGMMAYDYIHKRGVSDEDIEYYDLGLGRGRIVFPDFDKDNMLVYWVARSYDGTQPRYSNAPVWIAGPRENQIYNLGRFQREGFRDCTLVEGPVSKVLAGRDSIATYGKGVSQEQLSVLRTLEIDRIYLAFDPDARETTIKLAKDLKGHTPEIWFVPIPKGHDPATMGGYEGFQEFKQENSILFDNRVSVTKFLIAR